MTRTRSLARPHCLLAFAILCALFVSESSVKATTSITLDTAVDIVQRSLFGRGIPNDLVYSPDGKVLATASTAGIALYDTQTYREVRFIESPSYTVAFSPDGSTIATGVGGQEVVRLWHVSDGTPVATLTPAKNTYGVRSIAFNPDGTLIAAGLGDCSITVWRISDQSSLFRRFGSSQIFQVVFSRDGSTVSAIVADAGSAHRLGARSLRL